MHPSVRELEARVRQLPAVVEAALAAAPPEGLQTLCTGGLVLTGIGASEAVARSLEPWLRHELRLDATPLPLSSFLADDVRPPGRALVLLSQELSPNATLALGRAHEFRQAVLLTSLPAGDPRLARFRDRGGLVWTLPPSGERGLLVRMQGPMAAAVALARLGLAGAGRALPGALAGLPALVSVAVEAGLELAGRWPREVRRAPLVATGWYARCLEVLAWTWMEALWVEPPPVWDVLQLAHGPWQQRFAEGGPWLALTRPDDADGLWERLGQMLPPRQQLVRAPATLPGSLALFEHLAFVEGLLAGLLVRAPVDLEAWPGKGTDGPLYELAGRGRAGDGIE